MNRTDTTITLSWVSPFPNTHFKVFYRSPTDTKFILFQDSFRDSESTVIGLEPNTRYRLAVQGCCDNLWDPLDMVTIFSQTLPQTISIKVTETSVERQPQEATRETPPLTFEQIPQLFICPITQEVMTDPVSAADGFVYERSAIESWLGLNSTSPMTRQELADTSLVSVVPLRSAIQDWLKTGNIKDI
eukprot:c9148_g1_i3.p1 GENE.c9148_g1_i3~~c9148_g1_i3.p1  ORF type:complete len:188 (+),score=39.82 c9148_g1_i3:434-997(+)